MFIVLLRQLHWCVRTILLGHPETQSSKVTEDTVKLCTRLSQRRHANVLPRWLSMLHFLHISASIESLFNFAATCILVDMYIPTLNY